MHSNSKVIVCEIICTKLNGSDLLIMLKKKVHNHPVRSSPFIEFKKMDLEVIFFDI